MRRRIEYKKEEEEENECIRVSFSKTSLWSLRKAKNSQAG
jgi:hypothetical protein